MNETLIIMESKKEASQKSNSQAGVSSSALKERLKLYRKDYDASKRRIIERQVEKLKKSDITDLTVIRLAALIDDYKKSQNRMQTRLGQLIGLYYPTKYRSIRDYAGLAKAYLDGSVRDDILQSPMTDDMKRFLRELSESSLKIQDDIDYSENMMESLLEKSYPKFCVIATPKIAYRMIRKAGSFKSLVMMSASKLQLLGAEKALFRHLKNKKQQPPKYGILHEHPLMAQIKKKNHGKMARLIADKLIIAARMDYFGSDNKKFAKDMQKQIEIKAKEFSQ